jgi:hypothetical protein
MFPSLLWQLCYAVKILFQSLPLHQLTSIQVILA